MGRDQAAVEYTEAILLGTRLLEYSPHSDGFESLRALKIQQGFIERLLDIL